MRNLFSSKYMYLTAAMLTGAAMFTSCSNEDDMGNVNPTYDGESVKTQFAINIPAAKQADTRLGQDIVQGQEDPVFRGMDNISLIPFKTEPAAGGTGETPIKLGEILKDELAENTNAKVYYDVPISTDVTHFLFYGEAKVENGGSKENGSLKAAISETVNDIEFALEQINKTAASDGQTTTISDELNKVASATGGGIAWSASTTDLKNYYNSLLRLKAGSANTIKLALADLKTGIEGTTATGEAELKTAIKNAIDAALTAINSCTYPRNCNLPDGAAQVQWNSGKSKFEYINPSNIGTLSYTAMENYVYPSSLYYWVNTAIKCSNTAQADNYATDWNACLGLYQDGTTVTASTRSVALEAPIQYAVGRMDVSAAFKAEKVTDNIGGEVSVAAGGITLDGILIGGQKNLKWDFSTPVDGATEYTIYDAAITSTSITNSTLSAIQAQSLALQTTQGTEINFALELTNNTGASFTGKDGIVPAGGRFYLIGKLTPETGKADNHVFYQDHITYAKVTINSLENAYNCIPDLKSPKLELGLSVDLEWKAGLTQDVVIE